ncbi:pathogenesis-related thaumatin-like protein 3.5 [Elaeis guineensis]|uniref:pathogenesis-related thaumatin-like protein 3.5 n=1 Tax=Elaeis guineensis var. tenera TaxID=51953 RepID=UPI003C6D4693
MGPSSRVFTSVLVLVLSFQLSMCCTFTIYNNCPHTIWPGTLAGAGTPQLSTTGFQLEPGRSVRMAAPPGWSGRMWARTGCEFDAQGAGTCQTGDCGGRMECGGAGALPPATLFEITLGKGKDPDYYDVSLVDGYNLPVAAAPRVPRGRCNATGCAADLNRACPKELQVDGDGGVVACKSACEAFGLDEYCCSGEFGSPGTCKPSFYSSIFKNACPRAYSYAFDDGTSTFTCKAYDYTIIFCPVNGTKRSGGFSTGQAINGHGDESDPLAMASSATVVSFHPSFLLLSVVFFQAALNDLITSAFMNKVGAQ